MGCRQPFLRCGGCHSGDAALAAKAEQMLDYPPNASSVDLFTADEEFVLATWFEVDGPSYGGRIDDIFKGWNIPSEIPYYRRIDAAVAQILLERIQDHLPNWTALAGDRFVIARGIFDRRARRKIELWPHHLLTINWADSGPGFSWPVAYKATYVPLLDRTVVTASADCPEAFGGVSDVAIGAFGSETSILEGSRRIIISDWTNQWRRHDQERWAYLFDTGIVSKAEADAWADEVWGDGGKEWREDECPTSTPSPRAQGSA
jgi:hypothetical protein